MSLRDESRYENTKDSGRSFWLISAGLDRIIRFSKKFSVLSQPFLYAREPGARTQFLSGDFRQDSRWT
jgi:hypothetical protein